MTGREWVLIVCSYGLWFLGAVQVRTSSMLIVLAAALVCAGGAWAMARRRRVLTEPSADAAKAPVEAGEAR